MARREIVLARQPLPTDGTDLLECDRDRAALAAQFDDTRPAVMEAVTRGAGAAAVALLSHSEPDGGVLLAEPGRPVREVPVGNALLNPALWRDGLALACLARDRDAIDVLTAPPRIAAAQLPVRQADRFWLEYCLALAAAVAEPEKFAADAQAAEALMGDARIISPAVLDHLDRPLLALARCLATGGTNWNDAVANALEKHRAYYDSPERQHDRAGFLALGVMGLCAAAHDRGIETLVESPYLVQEVVRESIPVERSKVTYQYAPRLIRRPDEATWFLDLAGFPRGTRTHRLVEIAGVLVARYEASGAPGLPHAQVDLVHEDDAPGQGDLARPAAAVDAGELVWLAQRFATEAGAESLPRGERRARLGEAIACIGAVLDGLSPNDRAVRFETITSDRGRELYRREPGRFDRERLAAYRDALARQLERFGQQGTDDASRPDARTLALAAAEIIGAQVRPILEAIARDETGAVVAALRPRDDDYPKVFLDDAVDRARQGYAVLWNAPPDIERPSSALSELRCTVAPAGMLGDDNELSRHFPGGYRAIAHLLNPHRAWVAWKYVRPAGTGIAYDGLVWCDDHWAWFPKPYRLLRAGGAEPHA